jgi:competence protein ComEC
MTYVVGIALLACVLGGYNLQIAEFFGGSVHYLLEIIIRMCEVLNKIRIGHFLSGKPAIIWIVIYYLVFFLGLLLASNWNKFGKTILVIPFVALLIFSPKKDGKLYVKMLDVGQGDGICIITPSREVIFVDGGSSSLSDLGSEVLMPFLKANGISKIDYVMISHCDTDHISGIKELMEQELIPIDNIVVSEKENDIINLAKANGISIQYLCAGDVVRNEDISIKILAPDTINKNNMEDRNNESQVFLLEHGEFNMIFTGDVGSDELKKLAEEYELQVDILKAPHHGSNNSACYEFIKEIDAEYAMISAGKNNLYGHPGEDFIQLLEENGCKYDITFKNGQITVVSDGEEFWVKEMIYKK